MPKTTRTHALLAAALLAALPVMAADDASEPAAELTTSVRTRLYRNVKDFGAVGDGKADDTAAIQKAIDHNQGVQGMKAGGVVYFPPGVYKVTKRLNMWYAIDLQGDPRNPPTILLPSGTPDFQDPEKPNPVIVNWSGYNAETSDPWFQQVPVPDTFVEPSGTTVNNTFFTGIRHLKIRIEAGNPGAIGIRGRMAQQTILENLTLSAVDATCGIIGSAHLYKNIVIEGFGTGFSGFGDSAWTFRNVVFRNISGTAMSVGNIWKMSLLNVLVEDCGSALSIARSMGIFCAGLTVRRPTQGYAMDLGWGGPYIFVDLVCEESPEIVKGLLPGDPKGTTRLPGYVVNKRDAGVPDGHALAPEVLPALRPNPPATLPLADMSSPGNVLRYGAKGDNGADDTAAIQKAIDENDVVFLPMGNYRVTDTLHLRSTTSIVGEHSLYSALISDQSAVAFLYAAERKPLLSTPDTDQAAVTLRTLRISADHPGGVGVLWRCGGRSVMSDVKLNGRFTGLRLTGHGGGFIENMWVVSNSIEFGIVAEDCQGPVWFSGLSVEHQNRAPFYFRNSRDITMVMQQFESSPVAIIVDGGDRIAIVNSFACNWAAIHNNIVVRNVPNLLVAGFGSHGSSRNILTDVPPGADPVVPASLTAPGRGPRLDWYLRGGFDRDSGRASLTPPAAPPAGDGAMAPAVWHMRRMNDGDAGPFITGQAFPALDGSNASWAPLATSDGVVTVPAGEAGTAYLACELTNPDPYQIVFLRFDSRVPLGVLLDGERLTQLTQQGHRSGANVLPLPAGTSRLLVRVNDGGKGTTVKFSLTTPYGDPTGVRFGETQAQ